MINTEKFHKHFGYFDNEYDAANAYRSECEKIGEEAIRYVQD